jgi:putative chitinase
MIDRPFFFESVRPMFGGRLTQSRVDGLTAILDAAEGEFAPINSRWLAYILATAYHETGRTMQPVREMGGAPYFHKMYDPLSHDPGRAKLAKREGALPGDGVIFYGRGLVQITWRSNYAKFSTMLGVDLVGNPDAALELKHSVAIIFQGMRYGMFTGRNLADYFPENSSASDWRGARRIINGTDKADDIAGYAKAFYGAISKP